MITEQMTSQQYRETYLARTQVLLGEEDLRALADRTVVFAGCGGVGGAAILVLARMGLGGFVLADPGVFDEPDVNRQWAANIDTLERNKAEVYEEAIHQINPSARVRVYAEGVTRDNIAEITAQGDVVIDGLDFELPLEVRTKFYGTVRSQGLYCVSSPIVGFGTMTLVAAPDGERIAPLIESFVKHAKATCTLPPGFRNHFFSEHVDAFEQRIGRGQIPSSMIATSLSGVMQSVEVLLILLGGAHPEWRKPVQLPEVLVVEPMGRTYTVANCSSLFPEHG